MDGRCATPARQQGGVNIQSALRCDIKERRWQEHAVSCDDYGVGARGLHTRQGLGGLQRFRLKDFQAMPSGEALYHTGRGLLTAARRAIRLSEHQRDVMAGRVQGLERSLREFRSAGEN